MENYANHYQHPNFRQKLDPNSHNSNWFAPPPAQEPVNSYPEPPPQDLSISLFDSSEQQFLSGFFDNLVEDKNEFLIPGFDFPGLIPGWHQSNINGEISKSPVPPYHYPFANPFFNDPQGSMLPPSPHFHMQPTFPYSLSHQPPLENTLKHPPAFDSTPSISSNSSTPTFPIGEVTSATQCSKNRSKSPTLRLKSPTENKFKKSSRNKGTPLKDEQRKANHIASEQKRRDMIRRYFDQLTGLIPGANEVSCSKAVLLTRSADYIEELLTINRQLEQQLHKMSSFQS